MSCFVASGKQRPHRKTESNALYMPSAVFLIMREKVSYATPGPAILGAPRLLFLIKVNHVMIDFLNYRLNGYAEDRQQHNHPIIIKARHSHPS